MASLLYNLGISGYDHRVAVYATSADDDEGVQITAAFEVGELVAEFGQVPAVIRVTVSEPDGTVPADAWLDGAEPAVAQPGPAAAGESAGSA